MVYIRACKINVIPVPGFQGLFMGGTPIKLGPLKINIIKRVFITSSWWTIRTYVALRTCKRVNETNVNGGDYI